MSVSPPQPTTRNVVEHFVISRLNKKKEIREICAYYIQQGDPFLNHLQNSPENELTNQHIKYLIDDVTVEQPSKEDMRQKLQRLRASVYTSRGLTPLALQEKLLKWNEGFIQSAVPSWPVINQLFQATGWFASCLLTEFGPPAVRCMVTVYISFFQTYGILENGTWESWIEDNGGWNELLKLGSSGKPVGSPIASEVSPNTLAGPKLQPFVVLSDMEKEAAADSQVESSMLTSRLTQSVSAVEELLAPFRSYEENLQSCICGTKKARPTEFPVESVVCKTCGRYFCMFKDCSQSFDSYLDALDHYLLYKNWKCQMRVPQLECVCNTAKLRLSGKPFMICHNELCGRFICNYKNTCSSDFVSISELAEHYGNDHEDEEYE